MLTACCQYVLVRGAEICLFGAAGVWAAQLQTLALLFSAVVGYMVIATDLFEPFLVDIMTRQTINLLFLLVTIP
uniref:Uncharacterized protein n=1 Tax=Peronospora matthiolae TaxID=2874970 RepID=A0AAV1TE12_9STRA